MNNIRVKDGNLEIGYNKSGLPRYIGLISAPMMTEEERQRRVQEAIDEIYRQGFFIVSQKRVSNTAFDEKGEATTTKIVYRMPKTEDEARAVMVSLREAAERKLGKESEGEDE